MKIRHWRKKLKNIFNKSKEIFLAKPIQGYFNVLLSIASKCDYQKLMRKNSTGIFNHEITIHTEKTQEIIAMVPDGGNYKDLPLELQQTRKVHIAWTRLNSKKPSITIDTGHFHHFHY